MKAKKCDRCRKYYEAYEPDHDLKYSNMLIFAEENGLGYCEKRQYDLCPDCMYEAVKFMQCLMGGE
jgi:hypothetical protein